MLKLNNILSIETYGDNIDEITKNYHTIQELQLDNLKKSNELALLFSGDLIQL